MTTVIKRKYCNRKYKDYNIDDFKYEFGAHKEWHGLSTGGIAKVEGGYSFYEAFLDRVQQSSKGDDTKYVEMMRQIFPHYTKLAEKIDRNHYLLSDFKKEFDVHPEWHGLSTDGIGKVEGGRSFYKAFRTFVEQLSNGDCTKHVEMMRQIFPDYTKHAEKIDRNHYVLSDFKKEFDVHPEWHGLSTVGIYKVEGGTSFYKAFLGRVKQSSKGDDTKHVEMMRQIFPDYTKLAEKIDRNHYTLSDFKKEFDVHPEWHGLSTARIREVEGGLSFYEAFLDRVQQSSNGDDTKYVEMMRQIFPDYTKKAEKIDRNHYTLSDFKYEFDTHPEWHGLSTSGIAKVEGGQPFYVAFRTFAKRESCGNKKKQFEIMEQIFPRKLSMIYADRGYLLQYILEIVLRLVGNTRLFVEPAVMLYGRKKELRPDLIYEYDGTGKVMIVDVKLQTTSNGIEKDTKNYSQIVKEKYRGNCNLIFLCLNGRPVNKGISPHASNVTVRYYHVLEYLTRLVDNTRNRHLLRMVTGRDDVMLTQRECEKVHEIIERLQVLKVLVSSSKFSTRGLTLDEAAKLTNRLRLKLHDLAKDDSLTKEELLSIDYKKLLDF